MQLGLEQDLIMLLTAKLIFVDELLVFNVLQESIVLNFIRSTLFKFKYNVSLFLNSLQFRQVLPTILMSVFLMASVVDSDLSSKAITKEIDKVIHQDNEQRPKTTQEWNKQSRETEGKPKERMKRVEKQSVEAFKDFGSMYSDTAKRSASELENSK